MTALRDVSQLWAMAHVLVVFLLLFEPRRPWRPTIAICVSGAVVMSVVTLAAAAVLGVPPFALIFFTCSLPSMALFFSSSPWRSGLSGNSCAAPIRSFSGSWNGAGGCFPSLDCFTI